MQGGHTTRDALRERDLQGRQRLLRRRRAGPRQRRVLQEVQQAEYGVLGETEWEVTVFNPAQLNPRHPRWPPAHGAASGPRRPRKRGGHDLPPPTALRQLPTSDAM